MLANITGHLFLIAIIGLLVSAFILLIACKMVNVEGASLGKAVGSTFISGIVCGISTAILSFIPIIGTIFAFFISFLISGAITSGIFSCSYGKALTAEFMRWVISLIIGAMIFAGSCGAILSSFHDAGSSSLSSSSSQKESTENTKTSKPVETNSTPTPTVSSPVVADNKNNTINTTNTSNNTTNANTPAPNNQGVSSSQLIPNNPQLKALLAGAETLSKEDAYRIASSMSINKQPALNANLAKTFNKAGLDSLWKQQNNAAALDNFKNAYENDRSNPEYSQNYGYALHLTGDLDGAIQKYIESLELGPKRASVWFSLGDAYAAKEMTDVSYQCLLNAYKFTRKIDTTKKFLQDKAVNSQYPAMREASVRALNFVANQESNSQNYTTQTGTGNMGTGNNQNIQMQAQVQRQEQEQLDPCGNLYQLFKGFSDYTDLQREEALKALVGRRIHWKLKLYEVRRTSSGFRITTSTSSCVDAHVDIDSPQPTDFNYLMSKKTGDWIEFEGVIDDTFMRDFEIKDGRLIY